MRSKKELYEIILGEYKQRVDDSNSSGLHYICTSIRMSMYKDLITMREYRFIQDDFVLNKPSDIQHQEFFTSPLWNGGFVWWIVYDDTQPRLDIDIRTKFLEKLVEINE